MAFCSNCGEGLTITRENLTCLFCNRVSTGVLYGSPFSHDCVGYQTSGQVQTTSQGQDYADKYCQSNFLPDRIFREIILRAESYQFTKKNTKLAYCISTISILSENEYYVDLFTLSRSFDLTINTIVKHEKYTAPLNDSRSLRNFLSCRLTLLSIPYNKLDVIMGFYYEAREVISSGVANIIILACCVLKYLVQNNGEKIQKASSIVAKNFGGSRSTLLKHYKIIK